MRSYVRIFFNGMCAEQNRVMEKGEIVGLTIDGQFYNIQVGEKVRKDVPVNELRIADA